MYLTLLSEGMSFTLYNIITPWGAMPVHSTEKAPTVGLPDNGEKALTEDAQKCCVRKGFLVATSGDELVYVTQLHSWCIERRKGMEEEFSCAESDGKDGTILRLLIWPSANYTSASIFETRGMKHVSVWLPLFHCSASLVD